MKTNNTAAKVSSFAAFVASDDTAKKAAAANAAPTMPAKKQSTVARAASKPVAKKVKESGAIKFIVRGDGASKLFAHTAAWLDLTGLIDGGTYPAYLVRALGGSAYSYHTKQGNFTESQGMASLTQKGLDKFRNRENGGAQSFAVEDKEHYMLMMMEGLNDARLIKNASAIVPVEKVINK